MPYRRLILLVAHLKVNITDKTDTIVRFTINIVYVIQTSTRVGRRAHCLDVDILGQP